MLTPMMSWCESRGKSARDVINRASTHVGVQCVCGFKEQTWNVFSIIRSPKGNLLEVQMCAEISAD